MYVLQALGDTMTMLKTDEDVKKKVGRVIALGMKNESTSNWNRVKAH